MYIGGEAKVGHAKARFAGFIQAYYDEMRSQKIKKTHCHGTERSQNADNVGNMRNFLHDLIHKNSRGNKLDM